MSGQRGKRVDLSPVPIRLPAASFRCNVTLVLAVVIAVAEAGGAAPGVRLAGLSLLERAVLTAQSKGASRILVLVRPGDDAQVERLGADTRLRAALETVVLTTRLREALEPRVSEPFFLVRHDWVLDPAIHSALAGAPLDGAIARVAARAGEPIGAAWVSPSAIEELGSAGELEPLLARSDVARHDVGAAWAADARSAEGRRQARHHLFEACRKPVDGFISRHLNRHVSLFVSKRLVDTPVTPNAMTIITFSLAIVAAGFAVRGGYVPTLVAAFLMQCNSILDGCDGELARVRFQGSKLGQWLDTVGDDASNVIFWASLGIGASRLEPHGFWLALGGWIAAGANALAALENYALLARKGSGDFYALQEGEPPPPSGWVGAVVGFFHVILKQDFFLFLMLVLASAGVIHHALPIIALGGLITLGNSTARYLRVARLQPNSR